MPASANHEPATEPRRPAADLGEPRGRGLVIVYTGTGKGKTTAALGLAMRALGQGLRVLMVQFIKSHRDTGESVLARRLAPGLVLQTMGAGFVTGEWSAQDLAAARAAWGAASEAVNRGAHDMVILDEVSYCIRDDVIPLAEVLGLLGDRPPALHLVLTGRGFPAAVIAAADLVTEMQCIKHPYEAGVRAQPGIEF